jgi:glutathione S-transferase
LEYLDVETARKRDGMRLALTMGVPGPWSESAKSIFHVKGIEYAPVGQVAGAPNEELVAWTGCRNAPVAVWAEEAPRSGWAEILALAERIAPAPSLVPSDEAERADMFGLAHEICGEGGFGWNRRLMLLVPLLGADLPGDDPSRAIADVLGRDYGYTAETAATAPARCAAILTLLAERLASQVRAGSRYLVGDRLSAADIYWACFAAIVAPMPAERCPVDDMMRGWYSMPDPTIAGALVPELLAHRDFIYDTHLALPMDF